LAVPVFVTGLILLLVFGVRAGLLPVAGYDPSFPANLRYLILPGVSSGIAVGMVLARILARSVQDTAEQEFVESAIVWGLPRRELFWRYLMRPSLAPTIGLLGYVIGVSLTGTVIVEAVFNLPGVGTYLVKGVSARDYPVVEGSLLVFGILVVIVHFIADTVSSLIDPRTTTS
jgi:peptide/nickel transport system permease protein